MNNQGQTTLRAQDADRSTARDREMGRQGETLGDRGEKGKTWTPPQGEQGVSNRADDEAESGESRDTSGDEAPR